MTDDQETAALVALLETGGRAWSAYVIAVRQAGSAETISAQIILEEQLGLLAYEATAAAAARLQGWRDRGWQVVTMRDPEYPENLRVVGGRPPILFIDGKLADDADARSVAVIGTRQPTAAGRASARALARAAGEAGYTVVSGLAAGIDAEAHTAALAGGHRTVAVIGTGLDRFYPPENEWLQREIANDGAVLSQFFPGSGPDRRSFPMRNAVMSGLTLGTVIVEASERSGTRIQARHALTQGRVVVLMKPVLAHDWAVELAQRPGVVVAGDHQQALAALHR